MTPTTAPTAGQALAAEIRKMYAIGARTRWGAKRVTRTVSREAIVRDLREAVGEYRGIESEQRTAVIDKAHAALCAYGKFIENYRVDGVLRFQVTDLSPWHFAAFLGEMVDSGCSNMGEFEAWFAARTCDLYAARLVAA